MHSCKPKMMTNWLTWLYLLGNVALSFSESPMYYDYDYDGGKRCSVDLSARQSCGQANNAAECAARGCCFDECLGQSCASGTPNCYLSSYLVEPKECQVEDSSRENCGFVGTSLDACLIKGCCWKPSPNKGIPWCFSSKSITNSLGGGTVGNPNKIKWSSYEIGNQPSRSEAVVVEDSRGIDYYVGRIKALGGVFPAKIHTQWGAAYFGLEGLEITSTDFDALIKDSSLKLSWKPAQNGDIPAGAVVGGHAINDASHLYYVATGRTEAGDQPGYLDPEAGCAVIPYGWQSQCLTSYKVLVQESS